jgi:hypothetical protein
MNKLGFLLVLCLTGCVGESIGSDSESLVEQVQPPTYQCTQAEKVMCEDRADACVPGTACYDFKACYENVQDDAAAVQACVNAHPAGSRKWARLVSCECRCGWAPAGFCDGSKFGHPNG